MSGAEMVPITPEAKDQDHKAEENGHLDAATNVWQFQTSEGRYVPLKYKLQTKEQKLSVFSPVRHAKLSLFGSCLGLLSIAVVCLATEGLQDFDFPSSLRKALTYISAAWFFVCLALYGAKVATGGLHKLRKDWQHWAYSHFFSAITLSFFLLSVLVAKEDQDAGRVFFWIGAVPQIILTIAQTTRWMLHHHTVEFVTPLYFITPLSNMVGVLALVSAYPETAMDNDSDGAELAWFLFSFSLLMWFALFAILFNRYFFSGPDNNLMVITHMFWGAAPAVAMLAYKPISGSRDFDPLARFLFYSAISCFLWSSAVVLKLRFWRAGFDMAWWAASFPISAMALISLEFHRVKLKAGSQILATFFVALAVLVTLSLLAVTVYELVVKRQVFRADDKWGPISFMIILHKVFRASFKKMGMMLDTLKEDPTNEAVLKTFIGRFNNTFLLLGEHSRHEDGHFFKLLDWHFPGVCAGPSADHQNDYGSVQDLKALVTKLAEPESDKAAILSEFMPLFGKFKKHLFEHLSAEESHISPTNRKFANFEIMKEAGRNIFMESEQHWRKLLPFALNTLPMHKPRRRLLECFRYIVPERMQALGIFVYNGVEPAMWDELSKDIPEMIPRGIPGWVRRW